MYAFLDKTEQILNKLSKFAAYLGIESKRYENRKTNGYGCC